MAFTPGRGSPLTRRWLFRIAAILLSLTPLLGVEIGLRLLGLGRATDFDDPAVGFSSIQPLFVLNDEGDRYEIPRSRRLCFEPQDFPAIKPPSEFRIFCLGGSTAQGRPYSIPTAFPTWLELALGAADPSRSWRVVNCGGISYASYRLLPILKEVLAYQPDLILLYIGDNEFLEDRAFAEHKSRPLWLRRAEGTAGRFRLYNLIRGQVHRATEPEAVRPILPAEVDALLDYKGGLEAYHRNDAQRAAVIADYAANLHRMIALCRERKVPVILACPACNLETPPFKSEHKPGLSAARRQRFDALWEEARSHYDRSLPKAVEILNRAAAIDDEHAGLMSVLGRSLQSLGRHNEARAALIQACDWDVCPLRILSPMRQEVRRIAEATGTPFVDAFALFAGKSPGGIPGYAWLVDHVHPTIPGNQLLASAFFETMRREGWVHPTTGWQARRDVVYAARLAALDTFYYLKADQRLHNLEAWARGRAERDRSQGPIGIDYARWVEEDPRGDKKSPASKAVSEEAGPAAGASP